MRGRIALACVLITHKVVARWKEKKMSPRHTEVFHPSSIDTAPTIHQFEDREVIVAGSVSRRARRIAINHRKGRKKAPTQNELGIHVAPLMQHDQSPASSKRMQ